MKLFNASNYTIQDDGPVALRHRSVVQIGYRIFFFLLPTQPINKVCTYAIYLIDSWTASQSLVIHFYHRIVEHASHVPQPKYCQRFVADTKIPISGQQLFHSTGNSQSQTMSYLLLKQPL
jgi:hypothetical protein